MHSDRGLSMRAGCWRIDTRGAPTPVRGAVRFLRRYGRGSVSPANSGVLR